MGEVFGEDVGVKRYPHVVQKRALSKVMSVLHLAQVLFGSINRLVLLYCGLSIQPDTVLGWCGWSNGLMPNLMATNDR